MNNISWKKSGSLFGLTIIAGVLITSIGGCGFEILGGMVMGTGLGFMLWNVWMRKWLISKVD